MAGVHMAQGVGFKGVCYRTQQDASAAFAQDLSNMQGVVDAFSATAVSRGYSQVNCGVYPADTGFLGAQCAITVWTQSGTTTTAGTAIASITQAPVVVIVPSHSCDVNESEGDQIGAVNTVFAALLGAVAVIWGVRKVYTLIATNARE